LGDGTKTTIKNFSIGPFTRYYFTFKKFAVFPELSVGWGRSRLLYEFPAVPDFFPPGEFEQKRDVLSYRAGAGVTYFLASNVGVEATFSYTSTEFKTAYTTTGGQLMLGLQFYIPGKEN
jgi:hypothetical protein